MRLPEATHLFVGQRAVLKGRQKYIHLVIEGFAQALPTTFGLVFPR